jgi:hypothetical protein
MLLCERIYDSFVRSIGADYKTLGEHRDTASTHLWPSTVCLLGIETGMIGCTVPETGTIDPVWWVHSERPGLPRAGEDWWIEVPVRGSMGRLSCEWEAEWEAGWQGEEEEEESRRFDWGDARCKETSGGARSSSRRAEGDES